MPDGVRHTTRKQAGGARQQVTRTGAGEAGDIASRTAGQPLPLLGLDPDNGSEPGAPTWLEWHQHRERPRSPSKTVPTKGSTTPTSRGATRRIASGSLGTRDTTTQWWRRRSRDRRVDANAASAPAATDPPMADPGPKGWAFGKDLRRLRTTRGENQGTHGADTGSTGGRIHLHQDGERGWTERDHQASRGE